MATYRETLQEDRFGALLMLERCRGGRSQQRFVLVLLDASAQQKNRKAGSLLEGAISALSHCTRETDLIGWYKEGTILGVVFTEISPSSGKQIAEILYCKVIRALSTALDRTVLADLKVSVHCFPEDWGEDQPASVAGIQLDPELRANGQGKLRDRSV